MKLITNKYFQSAVLFVAIVIGYMVVEYMFFAPTESLQVSEIMPTAAVSTSTPEDVDLTGIHIMGNGDVMTGAGIVLPDAQVLLNGIIQLGNGATITPVVDFRK